MRCAPRRKQGRADGAAAISAGQKKLLAVSVFAIHLARWRFFFPMYPLALRPNFVF